MQPEDQEEIVTTVPKRKAPTLVVSDDEDGPEDSIPAIGDPLPEAFHEPSLKPSSSAPNKDLSREEAKVCWCLNLRTPPVYTQLQENIPPVETANAHKPAVSTKLKKLTPMGELIRRANSHPSSPFAGIRAAATKTAYSPYAKSSRSSLSRIAPLHPNRRTPPPPLPPPPPRKKSKKELELEEKWEEELSESVEGWACMADEERAAMRRAKRNQEMGYED
jgi:hypothetical protein